MKRKYAMAFLSMTCLLLLNSCDGTKKTSNDETQQAQPVADSAEVAKGKEIFDSKGCSACHSVDGTQRVGPSLKGAIGRKVTVTTDGKEHEVTSDEAYFAKSITDPDADIVKGFNKGQMVVTSPATDEEVASMITYIKSLDKIAEAGTTKATSYAKLTEAESTKAAEIYFDRCAGCHGMLRKGATGKNIEVPRAKELGVEGLKTIITNGLPGGMPPWGKSGIMSPDEVELIARFLQEDPPPPPEMSLDQMKASWKVTVPVADRPKKPEHNRNWKNYMGVILRDAGKVAIFDGDTHEEVAVIDSGFAVHILRSSASGRYMYSIGRDGKVTMIDLWMKVPTQVAEVKTCYDARSVDGSKYHGPEGDFRDKYLIVGGYWPPSLIFLDGQTLEPKKLVSTSGYTYDTNEFLREARAAAIVASHYTPEWVVNIKETGQIWLVDYRDINNLQITSIAAERFLHDGGWDSTHRYALMAANARDTISIVDTKTRKLVKNVKVGKTPHPGRGANINHPKHGPIWCTSHLGDATVACIGTDPEKHPKQAWNVVEQFNLTGSGGGALFVKTHPNSKHLWVDRTLNPDPKLSRSVDILDVNTFKVIKTISVPEKYEGKAVHFEYNDKGTEVWISVWSPKDKQSALLVYDDKTLELKKVIDPEWLVTPTGKFNVTNTMSDIY